MNYHFADVQPESNTFGVNFLSGLQEAEQFEKLTLILLLDSDPLVFHRYLDHAAGSIS